MKQIKTLKQLSEYAQAKKSVTCPNLRCFSGFMPAAFVFEMHASVVHRLIESGLFVWRKK